MTPLGRALKRKFRSPKDALKALGLPPELIAVKRLAFDGALPEAGASAKAKLGDLLARHLSGHAYAHALDLLHSIDATEPEVEVEQQEAEDDEHVDEEELREERRRAMATMANFLSEKRGMTEFELARELSDFPLNGLGSAVADEDLDQLMKDRRRRMARDVKKRTLAADRADASVLRHFPESARLFAGSSLEAGFSGAEAEQRLAMNAAAADGDSFAEMFPEAARIRIG